MTVVNDAAALLGQHGPFAEYLPGFQPRDSQQQMAARIAQAIADDETLIAESGTGTGKTLAYLVPALLSGRKAMISTGTRHLQDQLYQQDLPLVRRALQLPISSALLKGRSNYLCLHRLQLAQQELNVERLYRPADLQLVTEWAGQTRHGDIAEVAVIPEQSAVWPDVTSTVDNCLGSKCEQFDDCFVNRARRDAMDADVVVVNHHLFMADLSLREEGFGQLLPGMEVLVFDEAHLLPDIASTFFSTVVSQRQLLDLCRDSRIAEATEKSALPGLQLQIDELDRLARECRLGMGQDARRGPWTELQQQAEFGLAFANLGAALQALVESLDSVSGHGDLLDNCLARATLLKDRLAQLSGEPEPESVRWFETSRSGFRWYRTPLQVADKFNDLVGDEPRARIFTSATLTVAGSFKPFQQQLGLQRAATASWPGAFDYARQAVFYLPQELPEPNTDEHTRRVAELAQQLVAASAGGAFLLFTSFRALNAVADMLDGKLAYPMLVQGQAPRHELLRQFRDAGDAVLLGTGSFWEGVDVKGHALRLVIVDKLPFAAPDDPVLQARSRVLREQGRNPFREVQLPAAVVSLRQGAGRLIRDHNDHGVFVLCDPRLVSKSYGRTFLDSLPAMHRTRDFATVKRFFAQFGG